VDGFFLGGSIAPIGLSVSFLASPAGHLVEELIAWRRGLGQRVEQSAPSVLPDCAAALDPLEAPWTTELLVDCGEWTAYLNNGIDGGDPTAAAPYLASRLQVDCVIATHAPRHGPGHASTQLWLLGPDGEPPLMYKRTLAAHAEDGRWSWHEAGSAQPFEQLDRYRARLIKNRFDRLLLVQYLSALGIHVDDAGFYGKGIAVRQRVTHPVRRETASEVRDRFGW